MSNKTPATFFQPCREFCKCFLQECRLLGGSDAGMDFLSSIRGVAEKRAIGSESTIGSIVFMQYVADYGSRSGLESMVCSD